MFTLLRILEAEQTIPPCSHICKEALWNLLRPSLLLYSYLVTCRLFNFLYYQHSLLSSWTMCVTSPPGHKITTGWLYFDCRIGTVLFIYNVYNGSWHLHWFEETLIYQFFIGQILKNDRLTDKDALGQWLQENFFVIAGKAQVKLTLLTMVQFHKYPSEPTCTIPGVWGWPVVFLLWHQNAGW